MSTPNTTSYVCTPVTKPPLANPPPGWETAVIPPGTVFPHVERVTWYPYTTANGLVYHYPRIYRSYYWLPGQRINIELLDEAINEFSVIDTFEGPSVYHSLYSLGRNPTIMRMVAV